MTSACLTLLGMAKQPVWPFASKGASLLVEAFPAGQLQTWGLPHQGYGGADEGSEARSAIVGHLRKRLRLDGFEDEMRQSPDALDAVLCAFAAMAVTEGPLRDAPGPTAPVEGWIAVHR
jgi:hypothetical protein